MNVSCISLHKKQKLRRNVLQALGLAVLMIAPLGAVEGPAKVRVRIPEGPATETLRILAQQTGEQLLYAPEDLAKVRTRTIEGEMSGEEALAAMLEGTRLKVVREKVGGAIAIRDGGLQKNVPGRQAGLPAARNENAETGRLELEAVHVTGSHIRRTDTETSIPLSVFSTEELEARGASTMADLFETIGIAEPSAITEMNNGPQLARGDVASVDLRGMGSGSTLVLINGRRMAPHPISMAENGVPSLAANINAVPKALVGRVEILRDGASAIYGADAAAGVINSIVSPKGDRRGMRFGATVSQHGGANERGATLYDSLRIGRTRVAFSLDAFHRDALAARDRWWASQADLRQSRALPAPWNGLPLVDANGSTVRDNDFANTNSVNQWGQWQRGFIQSDYLSFVGSRPAGNSGISTSTTPAAGVATMSSAGMFYLMPTPEGNVVFKQSAASKNIDSTENATYSNWNNWKYLVPKTDRAQLGGFFERGVGGAMKVFGDVLFYSARSCTEREPTNFKNTDDPGIYMPASNPYNPFGVRFYHPTGAPNSDGTPRLVGTPADISLWTGISPGQNTGGGFHNRITKVSSYSQRVLMGLRGRLGESWEWETGLMYSGAQTHEYELYQVRESRLREALSRSDWTAFNPFPVTFKLVNNLITVDKAYSNPAAVLDPLYDTEDRFGRTNLFLWDAKANGRLCKLLRGGELGLASGLELRQERYDDKRATYSGLNPVGSGSQYPYLRENDNDFLALSSNKPIHAQQTIFAGYSEASLPFVTTGNQVPLVKALELTLAARYEHFSIFGQTMKPKASLYWKPLDGIKLRSSVSESFRAPNLVQTNVTPLKRQISADDPYRYEVTKLASDGTAQRTSYRQGNQNIKPEEAKTWTAGVVMDIPKVNGLSLTLDYFRIRQTRVIENMGAQATIDRDELLLDLATQAALAAGKSIDQIDLGSGSSAYQGYSKVIRKELSDADKAAFASYNAKQASTSTQRAPVGEIVSVVDDYVNLSARKIEGYELGVQWAVPKTPFGQFSIRLDATHYLLRRTQAEDGALWLDDLGKNGRTKLRSSGTLTWRAGKWTASWFTSYYGSFVDTSAATTEAVYTALGRPDYIRVFDDNGVIKYLYHVSPFVSHNASLAYRFSKSEGGWFKGVRLRISVNNVGDAIPPLADEQFGYQAGTANPRGRQFAFEVSRDF